MKIGRSYFAEIEIKDMINIKISIFVPFIPGAIGITICLLNGIYNIKAAIKNSGLLKLFVNITKPKDPAIPYKAHLGKGIPNPTTVPNTMPGIAINNSVDLSKPFSDQKGSVTVNVSFLVISGFN
ncbi:MAG: hypothetical protein ACC657_01265 [Thiohalomonadales bacterium]